MPRGDFTGALPSENPGSSGRGQQGRADWHLYPAVHYEGALTHDLFKVPKGRLYINAEQAESLGQSSSNSTGSNAVSWEVQGCAFEVSFRRQAAVGRVGEAFWLEGNAAKAPR